jgi:electron transfer flavoprotein alpha subunit
MIAVKSEYRGVWTLAETDAGRVARVSYELLTRGRALAEKRSTELTAAVLGAAVAEEDLKELIQRGADNVLLVEAPQFEHFLVEPHAACLAGLIQKHRPEIVIAAATTTGRTLMPYVAVKVRAGLTADCTGLDIDPETGGLLQIRPAIGGNIMATIKTPQARPQMATVRPRSTRPPERDPSRTGKIVREKPPAELAGRVRRVDFIPQTDPHALAEADIVVSAGRGIRKAENLPLVTELAEALDAALGASRDVVDRGWLEYPHQVGLSGKTVSPRLYVAVGISGAIQHLAGMQTAENIVAINSDGDAQIFNVADIGIVGDLFEVLPLLTKRIREEKDKQA